MVIASSALPAAAHRTPVALALWGPFAANPARCQRIIGFATARCAADAWNVRRTCLDAQLAGGSCDTTATDATVAHIHADTTAFLDNQCAPDDTQTLYFLLNLELDADIDSACRGAEVALTSGVYGPAQRRAASSPLDPTTLTCLRSTAGAATRLVRFAFDQQRAALDRIAVVPLGPSQKHPLVTRALARVAQAQTSIEGSIRSACPDDSFMQLYGRDVTAFLTDIALRANCLAGSGYVQDTLVCPAPVCGNGLQETGEQCDDGNTIDGDGCHSDCTLEGTP